MIIMKLQVKVSGFINSIMDTPNKVKIVGSINTITFSNNSCNDTTFFVNNKTAVLFNGRNLQTLNADNNVIIKGNIETVEFQNEKGVTLRKYYIPDCIIQLIDADEEPDYD